MHFISSLIFFYKKKYFLANIYLLFPPIWFLNYNDFHIDTLVIPILFFSIYSYHNFKSSNLYFFNIIFNFNKEYYATLVFFFAIYIFVDEKKLKQSIILILISLFFSFFLFLHKTTLYNIFFISR